MSDPKNLQHEASVILAAVLAASAARNPAERLRMLARMQGIRYTDLSRLSGVSYERIQSVFSGRRPLRPHELTDLSRALGVPVKE